MSGKVDVVTAYSTRFPPEVAGRLLAIRDVIREVVPGVGESIRYQMPAFMIGAEHLYIAAYKRHIGMYPMYGVEDIEDEIAPFRGKNTKDALHFPHNAPLPLAIIEKIVSIKHKKA